jgi:probable blue pigment (indigoidine) exporter
MPTRHVLLLTFAAACWGLGTVASKRAVAEIPPTVLLPVQLLSSSLILFLLAGVTRVPLRRVSRRVGLLGVLNPGLAYLLGLAGLASITAGLSVLLWSLEPVMILALAWLLLGDRMRARLIVLASSAVAGAVMAAFDGVGSGEAAGIALTVAAVACCALYTVAARAWVRSDESSVSIVFTQQLMALAFSVIVFAIHGDAGWQPGAVSGVAWISAFGSGVVYYGLAFWAFLAGLRLVSTSTAAIFLNLTPVFGIGAGHLLLGERMTGLQLAGAVTVMAAVTLLVGSGAEA